MSRTSILAKARLSRSQSRLARRRPKQSIRSIEALEIRTLLAADLLNQFAVYEGSIAASGASERIDLQVATSEFTLSGGKTIVALQAFANNGSSLNPAAVEVRDAITQAVIIPKLSRSNITGATSSLEIGRAHV